MGNPEAPPPPPELPQDDLEIAIQPKSLLVQACKVISSGDFVGAPKDVLVSIKTIIDSELSIRQLEGIDSAVDERVSELQSDYHVRRINYLHDENNTEARLDMRTYYYAANPIEAFNLIAAEERRMAESEGEIPVLQDTLIESPTTDELQEPNTQEPSFCDRTELIHANRRLVSSDFFTTSDEEINQIEKLITTEISLRTEYLNHFRTQQRIVEFRTDSEIRQRLYHKSPSEVNRIELNIFYYVLNIEEALQIVCAEKRRREISNVPYLPHFSDRETLVRACRLIGEDTIFTEPLDGLETALGILKDEVYQRTNYAENPITKVRVAGFVGDHRNYSSLHERDPKNSSLGQKVTIFYLAAHPEDGLKIIESEIHRRKGDSAFDDDDINFDDLKPEF